MNITCKALRISLEPHDPLNTEVGYHLEIENPSTEKVAVYENVTTYEEGLALIADYLNTALDGKVILGRRLYQLIEGGVKITGTFDPRQTMHCFEESLTGDEYERVKGFLLWLHNNGLAIGSANYETRVAEYLQAKAGVNVVIPEVDPMDVRDGVEIFNICALLPDDAGYEAEVAAVKEFCAKYSAAYYGAVREDFSLVAAVAQAKAQGKTRVVVEDLS